MRLIFIFLSSPNAPLFLYFVYSWRMKTRAGPARLRLFLHFDFGFAFTCAH